MKPVFVIAASVILSSVNAIVIPSSPIVITYHDLDDSRIEAVPQGFDRGHRGKVGVPAWFKTGPELQGATRLKKPCPGKGKGYGMGPFAASSSRYISDLLEKYGMGFKPSSPNPFTTPDKEEGTADFHILPHHGEATSTSTYEMHWSKVKSVDEWLEHVKERHSKMIGSHVFGDIEAYNIEMENDGGDFALAHRPGSLYGQSSRHREQAGCLAGRLARALRSLKPVEAFILAFTIGAGIGALTRILFLIVILMKRSHQHLNSPPALSHRRRSNDEEKDEMLPAYTESVDEKVYDSEKAPERAGIPSTYL